jgi:hypothetical protein
MPSRYLNIFFVLDYMNAIIGFGRKVGDYLLYRLTGEKQFFIYEKMIVRSVRMMKDSLYYLTVCGVEGSSQFAVRVVVTNAFCGEIG